LQLETWRRPICRQNKPSPQLSINMTALRKFMSEPTTWTTPMILPLDVDGRIYVLENEQGKIIGAGTRKACAILLDLILKILAAPNQKPDRPLPQASIRSATSI